MPRQRASTTLEAEAIEGYGEAAKITVAFSGYGRKKLKAAFAKLRKAEG